jgi:hypothetical protein
MSKASFHRPWLLSLALVSLAASSGCKNDKREERGTPPPPTAETPKPGACTSGGGKVDDPVQGEFLPRTTGGYCIDPQGDTKTYGDRGKLTMDQVCTTAVDGECEVYKSYGLKRTVIVRYIDGAGSGSTVEVIMSTFADPGGAFGMYTKRVVADADPAEPTAPRPLAKVSGAGALGNGRGYVWKGTQFVELQYLNEQESPEQLAKSSSTILTALAEAIGGKLPGPPDKPASAQLLPEAGLLANGISYYPKELLGISKLGAGAVGYYKEGNKRYRTVTLARDDADAAKDAMKLFRARPGASPIQQLGDEATSIVLQEGPDRPKSEYVVARKGNTVLAVADEELVLKAGEPLDKQADLRLTKDEKVAHLRAILLAAPKSADAGKK